MAGAGVFPPRRVRAVCWPKMGGGRGGHDDDTLRGEHLMAGGLAFGSQYSHTLVLRETQETACSSAVHLQNRWTIGFLNSL